MHFKLKLQGFLVLKTPLPLTNSLSQQTRSSTTKMEIYFVSVVDRYSTEKEGTVEEPDEDDIEIDLVPTTEALKAIEIVKL